MKRTIEINDVLPDCTESAIEQVKELLLSHLSENECDELPCLNNDLDYSGAVHAIIDGAVPIYTSDIDAAWFLHGSELEEAYENAGVGDNPHENNGMAAIYFYIQEVVNEWYQQEAQDIFDNLKGQS